MEGLALIRVHDAEKVYEARVAQAVLVAKDSRAKDAAFWGEEVGEEGDKIEEAG